MDSRKNTCSVTFFVPGVKTRTNTGYFDLKKNENQFRKT